jgi:hypothetical protein
MVPEYIHPQSHGNHYKSFTTSRFLLANSLGVAPNYFFNHDGYLPDQPQAWPIPRTEVERNKNLTQNHAGPTNRKNID